MTITHPKKDIPIGTLKSIEKTLKTHKNLIIIRINVIYLELLTRKQVNYCALAQ